MAKIDTSGWREFRVGDLFEIEPTKGVNTYGICDDGDVPYIAASRENNGCSRHVSCPNEWVSRGNCLVFIHIGDAAAGVCHYVNADFVGMKGKTSCAYNDHINEAIGLFLASVITANNVSRYSFSQSWTGKSLLDTEILLPATPSGDPDWDYMDEYMSGVMEEAKASLENLRLADEKKTAVDILQWKEFVIGELFPKIKKPPVFHNRQVIEDENGIPYIVRTKFDNGIKCRVQRNDEMKPSPAGVISFGAENATFFYQREEFVSGRDIYYIDTQDLSDGACMFLTACLQPIARKYSYNYGLFPDLLKLEHIKLPVDSRGCPDWAYMDSYMRDVIQNAESNIKIMSKSLA